MSQPFGLRQPAEERHLALFTSNIVNCIPDFFEDDSVVERLSRWDHKANTKPDFQIIYFRCKITALLPDSKSDLIIVCKLTLMHENNTEILLG